MNRPNNAGRLISASKDSRPCFDVCAWHWHDAALHGMRAKLITLRIRGLHGVILLAAGLHLLILGLFVFEVIPQQYKREGYSFWFHHGGDNYGYYDQAQALITGDFSPNKYPLGFPILMLPAMALLDNPAHDALVEPVALWWALVMFPIGQIILAQLTLKLCANDQQLTGGTLILWTVLPLLTYGALAAFWSPLLAELVAVHLPWAQMLSDGPATFFTLLALLVFWMARERDYPPRWAALLGFLLGFLGLIRLTALVTAFSIGLVLMWERRWLALIITVVIALLAFSPQLIYNAAFFGSPLTSGYSVLDEQPAHGLFSPFYLTEVISVLWTRLGVLLPLSLLAGGGITAFGWWGLWQRQRTGAVLVGLWVLLYGLMYSMYHYSWIGGLPRFLMPVYPALSLLMITALMDGIRGMRRFGSKSA